MPLEQRFRKKWIAFFATNPLSKKDRQRERKCWTTIKLDEDDAAILALMCKRACLERVEPFAAGETEARKMSAVLFRLQMQLIDQGFNPR